MRTINQIPVPTSVKADENHSSKICIEKQQRIVRKKNNPKVTVKNGSLPIWFFSLDLWSSINSNFMAGHSYCTVHCMGKTTGGSGLSELGQRENMLTWWYSFFPKVSLSAARWHMISKAVSAAPMDLMQWWIRPGPSRPCAISNPLPSPGGKEKQVRADSLVPAWNNSWLRAEGATLHHC